MKNLVIRKKTRIFATHININRYGEETNHRSNAQ